MKGINYNATRNFQRDTQASNRGMESVKTQYMNNNVW